MDGPIDRRAYRRTGRQKDGPIDRRADRWTGRKTGAYTNGRAERLMCKWSKRIDGSKDNRIEDWMDQMDEAEPER